MLETYFGPNPIPGKSWLFHSGQMKYWEHLNRLMI